MKKPGKSKRSSRFSVVAAVKANARTQVGQPKPARVLTLSRAKGAEQKHKSTLARTLASPDHED